MKHWAICVFVLLARSAFCADIALPEGKGKDVVVNACSACHSLDRITALRLSEEGWRNTLRQMIENGASLNPEDMNPIMAYLVANFGAPAAGNTAAVAPAPASIPAASVPDKTAVRERPSGRSVARQLQSRYSSHHVGNVLPLPWSGCKFAHGRHAARHPRRSPEAQGSRHAHRSRRPGQ